MAQEAVRHSQNRPRRAKRGRKEALLTAKARHRRHHRRKQHSASEEPLSEAGMVRAAQLSLEVRMLRQQLSSESRLTMQFARRLDAAREALRSEAATHASESGSERHRAARLDQARASAESLLRNSVTHATKLSEQVVRLRGRLGKETALTSKLQGDEATLKARLKEEKSREVELEGRLQEASMRAARLEQERKLAETQRETTRSKAQKLSEEVNGLRGELAEESAQASAYGEERENLEVMERFATANKTIADNLSAQVHLLQTQLQAARWQQSDTFGEVSSVQEERDMADSKLRASEERATELTELVESLQGRLKQETERTHKLERERAAWEGERPSDDRAGDRVDRFAAKQQRQAAVRPKSHAPVGKRRRTALRQHPPGPAPPRSAALPAAQQQQAVQLMAADAAAASASVEASAETSKEELGGLAADAADTVVPLDVEEPASNMVAMVQDLEESASELNPSPTARTPAGGVPPAQPRAPPAAQFAAERPDAGSHRKAPPHASRQAAAPHSEVAPLASRLADDDQELQTLMS